MADRQPDSMTERLRKGDETLVELFGQALTTNEWHALKIGTAGAVAGLAYATGHDAMAVTLSMTLVGYAIVGRPMGRSIKQCDNMDDESVAKATIKHEPWYFLVAYGLWFAVGLAVGTFV